MLERKSKNSILFIGTLSIVVVMVFSPQLAFAQVDQSRPIILPDSIFWGIKLAIENIQENFTFQDDRKAELILKHVEERDREAIELERQNKMIPIERLRAIQAEKLIRAELIIRNLERAHNIAEQEQLAFIDRRALAQATNDQERIAIQMQQRARDLADQSNLIEPRIGGSTLIEPTTQRIADRPLTIVPVQDIEDSDDQITILTKLRQRLENSFSTAEITDIRARFTELRLEDDPVRKELLADQLDEQVNSPLISITCLGRVDTLALSLASDPVRELQEQCPILRTFDTEVIRDFVNGVN